MPNKQMGNAPYYIGTPQVRAHFFTEGSQLVRVGRAVSVKIPRSPQILDDRERDAVLSVSTMKDLASPAGRFSVTMTAADYDRGGGGLGLLRLGDLCVIEMGPDKPQPTDTWYSKNFTKGLGGVETIMIGAIDDISEEEAFTADGRVSRTVTVEGRDFGRYLVDDMLWWDHWNDPFASTIKVRKLVEWPKLQLFGLPADIMKSVLDNWLFGQFDLEFNVHRRADKVSDRKQVRRLSEMLRYALAADTPEIPFGTTLMDYEGALWNMFSQVASAPWYVLSLDVRRQQDIELLLRPHKARRDNLATANTVWNTDLGHFDSQVCLTYRRNPWDERYSDTQKGNQGGDFVRLPTRVITDADVVASRLHRSIDEVHNVWRALAQVPDRTRNESLGALPDNLKAREVDLFTRFGPRPRIVDTPFYSRGDKADIFKLVAKLTGQLRDWDIHNEHMLNGEITMKGMAAVKVGDRLWWRRDDESSGLDFYVEAVEQSFHALSSWTTTVQVTRGQLHRDQGQPLFNADGDTVRSPAVYGDEIDLTLDLGNG